MRALLLALLLGVAVRLAAPPPSPTAPVVVAARAVGAGQVLTADDVRTVRLPSAAVPSAAPGTISAVLGRRAVVDLPVGLALVPELLADGRFDREPPPGTVVVPVRLDGAAALRLGDSIEVVTAASCNESSEPLAVAALVVGLGLGSGAAAAQVADGGIGVGLGLGTTGAMRADAEDDVLIAVSPVSGRRIGEIVGICRLGALIVP